MSVVLGADFGTRSVRITILAVDGARGDSRIGEYSLDRKNADKYLSARSRANRIRAFGEAAARGGVFPLPRRIAAGARKGN